MAKLPEKANDRRDKPSDKPVTPLVGKQARVAHTQHFMMTSLSDMQDRQQMRQQEFEVGVRSFSFHVIFMYLFFYLLKSAVSGEASKNTFFNF